MKRFAVVDKTNGNVDYTVGWGDERDIPLETLTTNQEAIEYDGDINTIPDKACYNPNTKTFSVKLAVSTDVQQISHVDGVANITVTYPDLTVSEVCHVTLDGQSVDVNVANGTVTFPFTNQVLGYHNLIFSSSSFYGKEYLTVEVV